MTTSMFAPLRGAEKFYSVGFDHSGRYMAGWQVGEVEPVDELDKWLLGA